ncbi:MAG TPA: hypothetical protein VMZ52_03455 [Bryobacteraceae bacterium]|nr:hypothetical protein [Bryobacteraceae bacterium]
MSKYLRTKHLVLLLSAVLAGCSAKNTKEIAGTDGPTVNGEAVPRQDGSANSGREVFRFETFGNEGFWTDAVRMPAGIQAARVTPLQALQLGLFVDSDALDKTTLQALTAELKTDPTGKTSTVLNDPNVTEKLVKTNAIIGMPAKGDKVGVSCALCHTITDASIFHIADAGSIGRRIDGPANHALHTGELLATAANSRALFPLLQLALKANGGKSLGRAPSGLTETSTEAEVDAYLSNNQYYPVGMFDDSFDGNGDPMHNSPLFRQDLAAPFGSEASIARLDNFGNLAYTALLDPTNLTTPGGRAFLHKLGGAAGDEIADSYVKVLAATGVKGYPFTKSEAHAPNEDAPLSIRVDNTKLLDLNAYLVSLQAPAGAKVDGKVAAHGRQLFRTSGCTGCHNVDQGKPVPLNVIAMKTIFPGDNPVVLAQRQPPLNPVQDTAGNPFDDKMAVVNASIRGGVRGIALPLLLDLARKPVFLHDNSVPSLSNLLDPTRGATAPHAFYLSAGKDRADMVEYLRSLDTNSH